MGPLRKFAALMFLVTLVLASAGSQPVPAMEAENAVAKNPLFAQSAAQILQSEFQNRDVSFLFLDAHTGTLLASRWDSPNQPVPLGSLIKPFIAVAYGEEHQFRYPIHDCKGESGGCWLPRGHGEVDIVSAVANSCNSYFRMLTAHMSSAEVVPSASRFGLEPPVPELSGMDLIGLGNRWLISPLHMARAYLELNHRRDQPGAREVVAGMAQSAREGTGLEVNRALRHSSALVKTGTAACTHRPHAPGDGFVVALVPAVRPEFLLMVRVHGVPGAKAATTAGRMLSRIEE